MARATPFKGVLQATIQLSPSEKGFLIIEQSTYS